MQPPEHDGRRDWRLYGLAAAFAVLLAAFSGRYGYHRDEFYFIALGGHPAFGYDDQPPLVPLLAHALDALSGGSLVVLRLPSALAGAVVVLVTGFIARELGATRGAQLLAAGCMAAAAVLIGISHLMSTTTYDVLAWTLLSWTALRALRLGGRAWLLVGIVAGVGLEIKTLIVFFVAALVIALAVAGPRIPLRDKWFWIGGALAVALWLPNLIWQATHGWPQLQLSKAIADGDSATSQPRWALVPFQFLLVSPVLCPVWLVGLWRLATARQWRAFPLAWALLVVVFLVTGGKPYYLAGLFPVLLAAGAGPVLTWVGAITWRRVLLGVALGLGFAVSAVLFLPIVAPADLDGTPIVGINSDAGEQVGWPQFVRTVRGAYDDLPAAQRDHAVIIGENYGEAGSILHSPAPPPTYSPQNSLWDLGPPPSSTTTAVVVGYDDGDLKRWFASVREVARIDDGVGLDNQEQGGPVFVVSGPVKAWPALWDDLKRLG